ncbi:fiber [Murine mastadenovirus A]|uniref:Fiber protein n=1 Tax=Murine adenovirus A serotype 1 TaxID=10530 RepID=SPIKE_ADEM1|nr:fiber protein [Murine mastadenovirus A]AP_000359.1 fiber [Murine mastadenovirus A]P19721.1 RecName: Full=Fiber protein; Short=SPIKE; AltName: Full=Protein IV [Murine adenovirus 1]AAA42434.1 fiber protein [Murine adenovirus 1]
MVEALNAVYPYDLALLPEDYEKTTAPDAVQAANAARPFLNPVYPYQQPVAGDFGFPIVMPPFFNSYDFTSIHGNTLSLRLNKPLKRTAKGLQLLLGSGLSVNADGQLESSEGISEADAPLQINDGVLQLSFGEGLSVNDHGELESKGKVEAVTLPLALQDHVMSLSFGQGLQVNDQGQLEALAMVHSTSAPLKVTNNNLELALGRGLIVDDQGQLRLAPNLLWPESPLAIEQGTNHLILFYNQSLDVEDGKLTLPEPFDPLTLDGGRLRMQLAPNSGLAVTEKGSLGINWGEGIQVKEQKITLKVTPANGLAVTEQGGLNINWGNGIKVDEQKVTLKTSNEFALTENGLYLTSPLNPIEVNQHGQLGIALGYGFHAHRGYLELTPQTLWTGLPIGNNGTFHTKQDCKIFLSLTRLGPMVHGTFMLQAPQYELTTNGMREITFSFNSTGGLEQPAPVTYWGALDPPPTAKAAEIENQKRVKKRAAPDPPVEPPPKRRGDLAVLFAKVAEQAMELAKEQAVQAQPPEHVNTDWADHMNLLRFMPNTLVYPTAATIAANLQFHDTRLSLRRATLKIRLNGSPDSAYQLGFMLELVGTQSASIVTDTISFWYYAEDY